jgi:hypothetical protein
LKCKKHSGKGRQRDEDNVAVQMEEMTKCSMKKKKRAQSLATIVNKIIVSGKGRGQNRAVSYQKDMVTSRGIRWILQDTPYR